MMQGFVAMLVPFLVFASFLLLLFSIFYSRNRFFKIPFKKFLLPFAVFSLALFLSVLHPLQFVTVWDELAYVSAADSILSHASFSNCFYSIEGIQNCTLLNKGSALSFLLAVSFALFGKSIISAFAVNALAFAFSSVIVFFIARIILKNKKAAFSSAMFFALMPLAVFYSSTLETNTLAAFFILLSLLLFLFLTKSNAFSLRLAFFSSLSLAVYSRPENFVLFPLFFVADFFSSRKQQRLFVFLSWSIPLILSIGAFLQVLIDAFKSFAFGQSSSFVPSGTIFSLENLYGNMHFFQLFFSGNFFPWILFVFFLFGVFWVLKRSIPRWIGFLLFSMPLALLLVYAFNFNLQERFFVSVLPFFALFCGAGFSFLCDYLKLKHLHSTLVLFFVLILFFPFLLFSFSKPVHSYLQQAEFIAGLDELREKKSSVVLEEPLLLAFTDAKGIASSEFLGFLKKNPELNGECFYYIEGLSCRNDFAFSNVCGLGFPSIEKCNALKERIMDRCKKIREKFNFTELRSSPCINAAFYKICPK